MVTLLPHRVAPQLTFAQARYANHSSPTSATFPASGDLFASLAKGDSIARAFLQVAVPTLSVVLVILWVVRRIVLGLERRRMARQAESWATLPNYAAALAVGDALPPEHHHHQKRRQQSEATGGGDGAASPSMEECTCMICFASVIDHPVELLPCGHDQFCARCLVQLWEYSGVYRRLACPLCRQSVQLLCPVCTAGSAPSIDDVILLHKYNGGFCGAERHTVLDQWVLRLRAVTNARLLPLVIGLRIVMLHATVFTYILLPENTTASNATAAAYSLDTPLTAATAVMLVLQRCIAALHVAATYSDDLFVAAMCIILTGSLLQSALFTDLKL